MTRVPVRRLISIAWLLVAPASAAFAQADPHAGHEQHKPAAPPPAPLPPFIPPVTEDDRKAAFPDVNGHTVHDTAPHFYALVDQLEWQAVQNGSGVNLDASGWFGGDRNRLWFRADGNTDDGRVDEAQAHVLYGRQFARWWDVVAGIRQDFRPGAAQTWAAVGVQGLAPYWFEIEATAYLGASGRTQARVEVEYELLLTNRLVFQPRLEVEAFGKSDAARGIGAGLSTADAGFRIRYEIRRELAPYAGVTWRKHLGETADLAETAGGRLRGARLVTGVRLWF